ncbi:type II toxin-antitoxin system PemK/MazF family toxin [Nostoc favosum]|uniref:Type II toxin-antitoxin system PemK/MazF family toxin n=1 Tax=Nostoc favosum CHAB5714 TaxID=2780399 RepID=A0ABS8IAI2_9NOSO|nr:type II toxin-antitoxin system PemK/MazF family toxin [Nostoc favosum]MCC5601041.1 type II toxin-antitoxin system PemK/MazF family toxin [Nostoc favosum CHAB5714]
MEASLENLAKGDVISIPFPFSDASATKRRPALVIAESDSNNIMVCPITSKPGRDYEIKLEDQDFRVGKISLSPCYIRPNIIATVDKTNVIRFIGKLKDQKVNEVITGIIEILQKPPEPPPPASRALERGKSPRK